MQPARPCICKAACEFDFGTLFPTLLIDGATFRATLTPMCPRAWPLLLEEWSLKCSRLGTASLFCCTCSYSDIRNVSGLQQACRNTFPASLVCSGAGSHHLGFLYQCTCLTCSSAFFSRGMQHWCHMHRLHQDLLGIMRIIPGWR